MIGTDAEAGDLGITAMTEVKQLGPSWSGLGFQATLSLRCVYLNQQANDLWSRKPLTNAA